MAYDALAESLRLLEGTPAAAVARLSRRTRHLPLAVDRDGPVAATMFLRRGVSGEPWLDVHSLELTRGGAWRILGGGSGNGGDAVLAPRPALAAVPAPAEVLGWRGTLRNAERLMPWGGKWVRWAQLRVAVEVTSLGVGDRQVAVSAHGAALVVWAGRRPPRVLALDAAGRALQAVALPAYLAGPPAAGAERLRDGKSASRPPVVALSAPVLPVELLRRSLDEAQGSRPPKRW